MVVRGGAITAVPLSITPLLIVAIVMTPIALFPSIAIALPSHCSSRRRRRRRCRPLQSHRHPIVHRASADH